MSLQVSEQQWALLYFRKKSQFNEYSQFKSKSFNYQTILGKLHFLASQDEENNIKSIKQYIKTLNSLLEQIKNTLSDMHEQMKFLKLQSIASLIQSFEELITSMHHYNIQDKKNQIENKNSRNLNQKDQNNQNCQKCLCSINKMNIKKIFDQITTTQVYNQDENSKMTKQQRRKMISQFDEYEILIAQKQNYIRKVNAVLQNKGKVCELSNVDKTYNFLSEYLSTIQKLQQKRSKSYKHNSVNQQQNETKWQEESYKHILEYIKKVIFEHFVNECSGPVKKIFEKMNIDAMFKSYKDQTVDCNVQDKYKSMKNHETQTIITNEVEQLKKVEKRLQFRQKQIAILRHNKDQLEKKFIMSLEMNRKIQSQVYEVKRQKKNLETQIVTTQQNLTMLTLKYQQKLQQFQEEKKTTFQNQINQRQKIMKISKQLQADYRNLQIEHKKCQTFKKPTSSLASMISAQTQTNQLSIADDNSRQLEKTDPYSSKKRKSLFKNNIFNSFKPNIRSLSRQIQKEPYIKQQDVVDQNSDNDNKCQQKINLKLQSQLIKIQVYLTDEERSGLLKNQNEKEDKNVKKKGYKLNKYSKNKFLKTQQSLNTTHMDDDHSGFATNDKIKRIRLSMNSFRKLNHQKSTLEDTSKDYKFSKFNRFTENEKDSPGDNQKWNLAEEEDESDHDEKKETSSNQKKIYQVSERLYKKKQKDNHEAPFQRVVQNGKQKFYIKKISRQSINYKAEKEKIKEISQILKPYVYNNNNNLISLKRQQSRTNLKSIRQRLSQISHSQTRFSVDRKSNDFRQESENKKGSNEVISRRNSFSKERRNSKDSNKSEMEKKSIGKHIIAVQHIIESEFAYLKAVGFIDFIMTIGSENKKVVKAMNKIESDVRNKFDKPTEIDLQIFGGSQEAQNYIKGRNFWTIDNMKENIMIYTKNDGLSTKVQKYFNLLRRANPELFNTLIAFLTNPIFAVYGRQPNACNEVSIISEDNSFVKDLFNQLQKFHKIRHNQCTHIADFLQKIGFYRYTYF